MNLGVYIGWRCPEFKWDCQRVGVMSKCFCGHLLGEHAKYNGTVINLSTLSVIVINLNCWLTFAKNVFVSSYLRSIFYWF